MSTLGHVRSDQKCPVCRKMGLEGKFAPELIGRDRTLICPVHRTSPTRYYVDTAGFGLAERKHYSDRDEHVFSSYPHAERYLETMRAAKDSRAGFDPADWGKKRRKEFKFETGWRKWVESRQSDWSFSYKRQVAWVRSKIVEPAWGGLDMRDVRTAHLIDLKTAIAEKYMPSVVKLVVGITCSFLSGLKARGDIKGEFVRPTVKVPQRDLWILDAEQQHAIIEAAPARYREILRVAAATGLRPCELCGLRVRDIKGGFIFAQRSLDDYGNLTDTKTGTIHKKPATPDVHRAMRDKLPGAYLFVNRSGKPFRPGVLSRVWKKAAIAAGQEGSTLYEGVRHSFATRTAREEEQEARWRTARKVGHANPATTYEFYIPRGEG